MVDKYFVNINFCVLKIVKSPEIDSSKYFVGTQNLLQDNHGCKILTLSLSM